MMMTEVPPRSLVSVGDRMPLPLKQLANRRAYPSGAAPAAKTYIGCVIINLNGFSAVRPS